MSQGPAAQGTKQTGRRLSAAEEGASEPEASTSFFLSQQRFKYPLLHTKWTLQE